MSQSEQIEALAERWRSTGHSSDRGAFLRAWATSDQAPVPRALEAAARFGSPEAADALDRAPEPAQQTVDLYTAAELAQAFGSWEAALVYYHAILRYVLAWWESRGEPSFVDTVADLRPTSEAISAWFERRSAPAAQVCLVWARAGAPRAELLDGRFEREGRAFGHLTCALANLAYVGAPLNEPIHSDDPRQPPRASDGALLNEEGARRQRAFACHHETREAVSGIVFAEFGREQAETLGFQRAVAKTLASFEARAAAELVRWLIGPALAQGPRT